MVEDATKCFPAMGLAAQEFGKAVICKALWLLLEECKLPGTGVRCPSFHSKSCQLVDDLTLFWVSTSPAFQKGVLPSVLPEGAGVVAGVAWWHPRDGRSFTGVLQYRRWAIPPIRRHQIVFVLPKSVASCVCLFLCSCRSDDANFESGRRRSESIRVGHN